MTFTTSLPAAEATLRMDAEMLALMLRLPAGITITAVRADPEDSSIALLTLSGPVPATGELIAEYSREWVRNTRLIGLRQV